MVGTFAPPSSLTRGRRFSLSLFQYEPFAQAKANDCPFGGNSGRVVAICSGALSVAALFHVISLMPLPSNIITSAHPRERLIRVAGLLAACGLFSIGVA